MARPAQYPSTLLPALSTLLLAVLFVPVSGCANEPAPESSPAMPVLETRADSLAMTLYDAYGGPDAWSAVRYVRFDFGRETDSTKTVFRRHLWDRYSGEYRLEWEENDTTVVVLFNVNTREGRTFRAGKPVDDSTYVTRAYRGFINDTYWLLAPTKLLDPGVTRALAPDSATTQYEVVTTTYEGVGLTPGDQFWFWIDRETGLLGMWGYILEGQTDRPITKWAWMDPMVFETAGGMVRVAPRKQSMSGGTALMTDNVALPATVDPDSFTRPDRML